MRKARCTWKKKKIFTLAFMMTVAATVVSDAVRSAADYIYTVASTQMKVMQRLVFFSSVSTLDYRWCFRNKDVWILPLFHYQYDHLTECSKSNKRSDIKVNFHHKAKTIQNHFLQSLGRPQRLWIFVKPVSKHGLLEAHSKPIISKSNM